MTSEEHSRSRGYVGVGRLAEMLGVSATTIRSWESAGLVPRAGRIAGRDQRVWPAADLETIKARVEAKRAAVRRHGDAA